MEENSTICAHVASDMLAWKDRERKEPQENRERPLRLEVGGHRLLAGFRCARTVNNNNNNVLKPRIQARGLQSTLYFPKHNSSTHLESPSAFIIPNWFNVLRQGPNPVILAARCSEEYVDFTAPSTVSI